jgi:hypothetical protein
MDLYHCVLDRIFGGFLERDSSLLERIAAFDGDVRIEESALVFTVPGLFDFARRLAALPSPADRVSYLRFRKQLYSRPTNAHLATRGGRVEVAHVGPDHDQTLYRLIRVGGASTDSA